MKLAKTIAIMVLSVLLAFSLFFNIFIVTILEIKDVDSFKQVLLCRELFDSLNDLSDSTAEEEPEDTTKPDDTELESIPDSTTPVVKPAEGKTIYNDNGVKIVYVEQELGLLGPSLKFYIENNSDQTLDISLTDVYIDGFKADFCGLTCSNLEAGKKAYESFAIWESDYEDFTEFPSVVQFVVEIKDSESWNTIDETEHMSICLS